MSPWLVEWLIALALVARDFQFAEPHPVSLGVGCIKTYR